MLLEPLAIYYNLKGNHSAKELAVSVTSTMYRKHRMYACSDYTMIFLAIYSLH